MHKILRAATSCDNPLGKLINPCMKELFDYIGLKLTSSENLKQYLTHKYYPDIKKN